MLSLSEIQSSSGAQGCLLVDIIDDNDQVRRSLDSLFRSVDLETRLFGSATEYFGAPRPNAISCIVVDVRLPGLSGLDFQEQLVQLGVDIPVVLMTGHGDIPMSVRAMKAGAIDFLPKPFRDQDMLDAVSAALRAARKRRDKDAEISSVNARYAELTDREKQVMSLVAAGLMNKQVAANLSLSEVTVKMHRGSTMRKMQARSVTDLVRMADVIKRNGLGGEY